LSTAFVLNVDRERRRDVAIYLEISNNQRGNLRLTGFIVSYKVVGEETIRLAFQTTFFCVMQVSKWCAILATRWTLDSICTSSEYK
jgi:hypothetical protein